MGYFDPAYFDPAYFDTGVTPPPPPPNPVFDGVYVPPPEKRYLRVDVTLRAEPATIDLSASITAPFVASVVLEGVRLAVGADGRITPLALLRQRAYEDSLLMLNEEDPLLT